MGVALALLALGAALGLLLLNSALERRVRRLEAIPRFSWGEGRDNLWITRLLHHALAEPIVWEGDLEDDCSAEWRGMVAWAECMGVHCECSAADEDQGEHGTRTWAFAVSRTDPSCRGHGQGGECSCEQIWHSGDDATHTTTGRGARAYAERIMRLAEIERLIGG